VDPATIMPKNDKGADMVCVRFMARLHVCGTTVRELHVWCVRVCSSRSLNAHRWSLGPSRVRLSSAW
jgi:hypothetical protein